MTEPDGVPETQYTRSGDVSIAYQVASEGQGARELKGIPGEWRLYAAVR